MLSYRRETALNVLSYGIKICTDLSSILSGITRVTDRRTDGRTDRNLLTIPRLHYMQRGKNPSMLSRVIAKKVGDVFLRHSVEAVRWKVRC